MGEERPAGVLRPRVGLRSLAPAEVAAEQRRRILAAVPAPLSELGWSRTSVESFLRGAGVSRRTFYDLFDGKDDVFLTVHRDALAALGSCLHRACPSEPEGPARVLAGLRCALAWAAADAGRAMTLCAQAFFAGPHALACQEDLCGLLAPPLRALRGSLPVSALQEKAVLGGVIALVDARLQAGDAGSLASLAPSLGTFLLTPYLGPAQARRIATGST